jgi:hypothetical protein
VIVSTVRGVIEGWLPLADDAIIAVRSYDVLTTHPPLVGQFSASSAVIDEAVHSPGPLLFWLLAIPVRLGGVAPAITMGIVNTLAVIGVVALARRRGGMPLMFAAGAGVALMCVSLDAAILHDVWNPAAGLLAFTLLIFIAWSLACGEWRLLPLAALVASFTAQTHLSLALPAAVMTVIAPGFLVASRPRIPRRWVVATAAVIAVCWIGPLVEQVIHRPGNVELILRVATDDGPTFGAEAGWRAVVHSTGVPPWWLRPPRGGDRFFDVSVSPPWGTTVTALLIIAALVVLTVIAFRKRRRDLAASGVIALSLLPCVALVAASTSTEGILFATVSYTLWWASPAGMFVWLVLLWSAAGLLLGERRVRVPRPVLAGAAAGVAAIGGVVAASGEKDPFADGYDAASDLGERTREEVPRDDVLFVDGSETRTAFELVGGILFELRRDGVRVVSDSLPGLGSRYKPEEAPPDWTLYVAERGDSKAPHRGRVLARAALRGVPADAPQREQARGAVSVVLARFDDSHRR